MNSLDAKDELKRLSSTNFIPNSSLSEMFYIWFAFYYIAFNRVIWKITRQNDLRKMRGTFGLAKIGANLAVRLTKFTLDIFSHDYNIFFI
jgi:hypothetical protein